MNNEVEVVVFKDAHKNDVIDLIVAIQQREFAIPISAKDQPDLNAIPTYYQENHGNFWVATLHGAVIGTIALLHIGNNQGALRKMFVDKHFRGSRYNTANLLLTKLFDWAHARHFKEIYLGTTSKFLAAHRFYEKNGFISIDKSDLPGTFPVMEVDVKFYKYVLP